MATLTIANTLCGALSVCYGYLYNFFAVDDSRELTSSADWDIPERLDIEAMWTYLGGINEGDKLKTSGTTYWDNGGGTNDYGFDGIGSGGRNVRNESGGGFSEIKRTAFMWGKPNNINYDAVYIRLEESGQFSYTYWELPPNSSNSGYPVRLVKDAIGVSDGTTTAYLGNDGKVYNAVAINGLYWTTENLEETQYRNLDYIQGYDGGVYTPISNAAWAALTTGALCLYDDNLDYACK